jgi:hypothetical protein
MDELIELFSVINELEKGALGLFFELNYLIGAFLAAYTTWFVYKFEKPLYIVTMMKDGITPAAIQKSNQSHFDHMYNWIWIQYCYLFFSVFMVLVVTCLYKKMNNQGLKMKPAHHHDHEEVAPTQKGTAINDDKDE